MNDDTLVRHRDGTLYYLVKRSTEASLVREVDTEHYQYVPNGLLEEFDAETEADEVQGRRTPDPEQLDELYRRFDIHDPRVPELLEYFGPEPVRVRTLLAKTTFCESDLHGLLGELTAAGVLEERRIAGERCYSLTTEAKNAPPADNR